MPPMRANTLGPMSEASLPTFTIVTPSYNQAPYLELTIQSLLSQTYPRDKIQIIVMDGGSTDGSVELLQRYSDRIDYWTSRPDGGQANAINQGMARADGDIVGWLNSDDAYLPETLAKAARVFQNANIAASCADALHWEQSTGCIYRTSNAQPSGVLLRYYGNTVAQPTCFWRREVWTGAKGLNASLHRYLDYEFHLRLFDQGYGYHYTPEARAVIVWHGANKCATLDPSKEHRMLMQQYGIASLRIQQTFGKFLIGVDHLRSGKIEYLFHALGARLGVSKGTRGLGRPLPATQAADLLGSKLYNHLKTLSPETAANA